MPCRTYSGLSCVVLALLLRVVVAHAQQDIERPQEDEYFASQTDRYRLYLGSDMALGLGFKANSLSYTEATALVDVSLTPKVGIFIFNRLLAGVNFDIFGSQAAFDARQSYSLHSRTLGLFARYYLKGGVFGELQYGFGKGYEREKFPSGTLVRAFRSERYSVGLGLAHFWTRRFNFELLLKYSNSRGHFRDEHALYLSGLNITAGCGVVLGRQ